MAETIVDLLKNSSFEAKMDALIAALGSPSGTSLSVVVSAAQPTSQETGDFWYKIKS